MKLVNLNPNLETKFNVNLPCSPLASHARDPIPQVTREI